VEAAQLEIEQGLKAMREERDGQCQAHQQA
jgi:hypothetical protein